MVRTPSTAVLGGIQIHGSVSLVQVRLSLAAVLKDPEDFDGVLSLVLQSKKTVPSSEAQKFLMNARLSSRSSLCFFVCVLISICSVSNGFGQNFQRGVVPFLVR